MKVTQRLLYEVSKKYKPKYQFHAKEHWKTKGRKMNFPRAYMPPEVLNALNNSPEEMLTSLRYENEIKQNTVIDYDQYLTFEKRDLRKLLIREDPLKLVDRSHAYMFDQYRRFEYGDAQASLLTKTNISKIHFPNLLPVILPSNARQIIERFILKANWWITDEDKFPKRYNPRQHIYHFKAEYGITIKNSIRYLLKDLLEYCEHITDTDKFRLINKDHMLETFYIWNKQRIQFIEKRDFVISHSDPLTIFQDKIELWNPECYLNLMGPVDPRIDMKLHNHYPLESCDGWTTDNVSFQHPHILTVNLDLPNQHSDFLEPEGRQITQSEKNAIGIMNCFAQCVATARRLFGNDAVDNCKDKLPHPICVHAICFDGVQFDFISYQLNSTDFCSTDVANLAWIDAENTFFRKTCNKTGMLRNMRYENLDLNVFVKFLQYFQFGLNKNK